MDVPTPIEISGHAYDPATLDLLRSVLDQAWSQLSDYQKNRFPRSQIAERLLQAVAQGERNPDVLRSRALDGIEPNIQLSPKQPA